MPDSSTARTRNPLWSSITAERDSGGLTSGGWWGATRECGHNVGVQDLGSAAALLLAAVFAWAGAVKLAAPSRSAAAFRDLGVPVPRFWSRAVPLIELAISSLLIIAPRAGAVAALGALSVFTLIVLNALRQGKRAGCGCFGATTSSDELSYVEPARNALLALAAVAALSAAELGRPSLAATVAVSSAATAGALALGLLRLRQRVGVVWATPLPGSIPPR